MPVDKPVENVWKIICQGVSPIFIFNYIVFSTLQPVENDTRLFRSEIIVTVAKKRPQPPAGVSLFSSC
jgi:hypothetical protein